MYATLIPVSRFVFDIDIWPMGHLFAFVDQHHNPFETSIERFILTILR